VQNKTLFKGPFKVRRLEASDAESYREIRLKGLKVNPEAFGASWDEEASYPLA
jgi:hypothetical protein